MLKAQKLKPYRWPRSRDQMQHGHKYQLILFHVGNIVSSLKGSKTVINPTMPVLRIQFDINLMILVDIDDINTKHWPIPIPISRS